MFLLVNYLLLFIGVLAYFSGGLIASMALVELKTARKYVPILVSAAISVLVGSMVLNTIGLVLSIVISLAVFLLIVSVKKIDTAYVLAAIMPFVLIYNNIILIQTGLATFLFQGMIDYKEKKNTRMLHRGISMLVISGLILLAIFFFA